jgi:hypothetical protein
LQGGNYSWNTGDTTRNITADTTGTYWVQYTDTSGCRVNSDTITVNAFFQSGLISANGPVSFCDGDSVIIGALSGNNYNWSNGDTTQIITADSSGSYWVQYIDTNGCGVLSDTIVVNEFPVSLPAITQNGNQLVCTMTSLSFQWYQDTTLISGATDSSYYPLTTGDYLVEIIDTNGCPGASSTFHFIPILVQSVNADKNLFTWTAAPGAILLRCNIPGYVRIFSDEGRLIASFRMNQEGETRLYQTNDLAPGIYIVQGISGSRMQAAKFLVAN